MDDTPMADTTEKNTLDQLAAELASDGAAADSGGAVDQNDIDALLAEFQNSAAPPAEPAPQAEPDPPAESVSSVPDDPATEAATGGGPIGQDEIDRLLGGGDSSDTQPPPEAGADAAGPAHEDDDLSDQEKMDRLIAELQAEGHEDFGADGDEGTAADPEVADADTDAASPVEPDSPSAPGDSPPVAADAPCETDTDIAPAPESLPEAVSDGFDALDDAEMDLDGYEDPAPLPPPSPEPEETQAPHDAATAVPADDAEGPEPVPEDPPAPPEPPPVRRRAVALQEKRRVRRWPGWAMAAATVLLAALGGAMGYHYFTGRQPVPGATPEAPGKVTAETLAGTEVQDATATQKESTRGGAALQNGLEDRFARIEARRQAMLEKQNEILALRREYETGIQEIEEGIVLEATERGIKRYAEAAALEAIDYGLRTIQRRLDYIKKLDVPIQRLHDDSEAMLYAGRLATVNLMLVGLAEGIDSASIGRQMDAALAAHAMDDALHLDGMGKAPDISLEKIWERIAARMHHSGTAAKAASAAAPLQVGADDQRIWAALCKGGFEDKYRLTSLSPEAAGCLARWQGAELFLNRLAALNPSSAEALSKWPGQWLAMNRIERLSDAAAKAIFQWQGGRLSMNGLRRLPDEAAVAVANWPGKELELMGLDRLSLPIAKALAHWKQNGGRLFVPEKFYRKE
jgi:hypothetical protein